jgi:hypothetical protein
VQPIRAAALLLLVSLVPLSAQLADSDHNAYQSFFLTVALLSRFVPTETKTLVEPTLPTVLGLNEAEMQALNSIATDYEAKSVVLARTHSHIIMEARLRAIESGDSSDWLARQTKAIDDRARRLLADHVLRIQRELGESRFQAVAAYVRDPSPHCYITPCGPKPMARR